MNYPDMFVWTNVPVICHYQPLQSRLTPALQTYSEIEIMFYFHLNRQSKRSCNCLKLDQRCPNLHVQYRLVRVGWWSGQTCSRLGPDQAVVTPMVDDKNIMTQHGRCCPTLSFLHLLMDPNIPPFVPEINPCWCLGQVATILADKM